MKELSIRECTRLLDEKKHYERELKWCIDSFKDVEIKVRGNSVFTSGKLTDSELSNLVLQNIESGVKAYLQQRIDEISKELEMLGFVEG